jgi:hypothetical protein
LIFKSNFFTDNPLIAAYGFKDNYPGSCEKGPGVKMSIASMSLWFVCILLLLSSMVANCNHQAARSAAETQSRANVRSPVNPGDLEQAPAASIMQRNMP